MNKKQHLIWIDLEMTGLDPQQDFILEIAAVVTTSDLDIVAQGPDVIIHQPQEHIASMSYFVRNMHANSGLLDAVKQSSISVDQAQMEVLTFLKQYCEKNSAPLCGNSVWVDRFFLKCHMPELYDFFHYRTIDVSTLKELAVRWYPNQIEIFKKLKKHRALDDIQESIAELKYYKNKLFLK